MSTQPYEGVSKRTVPNLGSVPKGEACPLPSRFLSHAEKMRHLKSVDEVATSGAVGCHETPSTVDWLPLSILLTQKLLPSS